MTPDQIQTARIMRLAGKGNEDIADLFGVSRRTLQRWLVKAGVKLPSKATIARLRAEAAMIELATLGMTAPEAARAVGQERWSAYRLAQRNDAVMFKPSLHSPKPRAAKRKPKQRRNLTEGLTPEQKADVQRLVKARFYNTVDAIHAVTAPKVSARAVLS